MKAYLILKKDAGPWEQLRHLFPQIPIKSIHPILASHRGNYCPCYEIDGDKLTEEQVQALASAIMWQSEDDSSINFEKAAAQVRRRVLISKHWASQVYSDSPTQMIISTEEDKFFQVNY